MVRWFAVFLVACGGGGGFPDAPPIDSPVPGGRFMLSWTLTDTNGAAITCDELGGPALTVLMHNRAIDGGTTEVFVCSTGMGTSQAFAPGAYDFMYELRSSTGVIATATPQTNIVLESDQTTVLPPITFRIDAQGQLDLKLNTGKPAGNCPPQSLMGAGINAMTITLVHNDDLACEPITLVVGQGANNPATVYTINCTSPASAPCIENDQPITAMGVRSDSYTIHIRGRVGATDCWKNDDQIIVPANGMTLTRTLNLGFATTMPGC